VTDAAEPFFSTGPCNCDLCVLRRDLDAARLDATKLRSQLAELQIQCDRVCAVLAPTVENKDRLARSVTWHGSNTDFVTDLLAAQRTLAGLEVGRR
jgi:hypothetical protein